MIEDAAAPTCPGYTPRRIGLSCSPPATAQASQATAPGTPRDTTPGGASWDLATGTPRAPGGDTAAEDDWDCGGHPEGFQIEEASAGAFSANTAVLDTC